MRHHQGNRLIQNLLLLTGILIVIAGYLLHPEDVFYASLRGVGIWWDVVFPATLPFLIVAELAMGLGLPHFLGVFLQPWMQPLFRLPGMGSFVLTMGFASGYPMAAKLTVRMKQRGYLTPSEAERLAAFTTTADPLFITAAVAVGFFHNAGVGTVLAIIHYTSALILGIILAIIYRDPSSPGDHNRRDHSRRDHSIREKKLSSLASSPGSIIHRAYRALEEARMEDGRPFGRLMADAVNSALTTTLMIGGLIIFFSVLMRIFELTPLIQGCTFLLEKIFFALHLPPELSTPLIQGLFEVTLGERSVADAGGAHLTPLHYALASAILAWGGLSVHAQVATILSEAAIRYWPFFIARIMHSVLAPFLLFILWPFLNRLTSSPSSQPLTPHTVHPVWALPTFGEPFSLWRWVGMHGKMVLVGLALLVMFAAINVLIASFVHTFRLLIHQKNLR